MSWIVDVSGVPSSKVADSTRIGDGKGAKTPPPTSFDVILQPEEYQPAWDAYRVAPPLTRVWAGDDPANPRQTVQLQFPDQATALTVLAALVVPDA